MLSALTFSGKTQESGEGCDDHHQQEVQPDEASVRPLFWKIRIGSWSKISFPSPFLTGISSCPARGPLSLPCFVYRGAGWQQAGAPSWEPAEAVGDCIAQSRPIRRAAGCLLAPPAVPRGLAKERGGDTHTCVWTHYSGVRAVGRWQGHQQKTQEEKTSWASGKVWGFRNGAEVTAGSLERQVPISLVNFDRTRAWAQTAQVHAVNLSTSCVLGIS